MKQPARLFAMGDLAWRRNLECRLRACLVRVDDSYLRGRLSTNGRDVYVQDSTLQDDIIVALPTGWKLVNVDEKPREELPPVEPAPTRCAECGAVCELWGESGWCRYCWQRICGGARMRESGPGITLPAPVVDEWGDCWASATWEEP
jgi:hypothetical protein